MVLTFGIDLLFHLAVFEGNASSRHCLLDDERIAAAFEKRECRKGDIGFDNMLTLKMIMSSSAPQAIYFQRFMLDMAYSGTFLIQSCSR